MNDWIIGLISGLISGGIMAFLTYFFGLQQYFKRKESARVYKIYIENGIEKLLKHLNFASNICYLNFRRIKEFLVYFKLSERELDSYDKEILFKIEKELDRFRFLRIIPEISLQITDALLGNKFPREWVIDTIIDYQDFNDYIVNYVPTLIKKYGILPTEEKIEKNKLIENIVNQISLKWNQFVTPHEILVKTHLPNLLLRINELNPTSFQKVDEIQNDKKIQEILKEIEKDYKQYKQTKSTNQNATPRDSS